MRDNAVGLWLLIRLTCLKQAHLFRSQPQETTSRGRSPIFHLGTRLVAVTALSHLHTVTLCIFSDQLNVKFYNSFRVVTVVCQCWGRSSSGPVCML